MYNQFFHIYMARHMVLKTIKESCSKIIFNDNTLKPEICNFISFWNVAIQLLRLNVPQSYSLVTKLAGGTKMKAGKLVKVWHNNWALFEPGGGRCLAGRSPPSNHPFHPQYPFLPSRFGHSPPLIGEVKRLSSNLPPSGLYLYHLS